MAKKRSRKVHYYIFGDGIGTRSICDCKSVFTTKLEKVIDCKKCLRLLINNAKGDRKRRLERQLKAL